VLNFFYILYIFFLKKKKKRLTGYDIIFKGFLLLSRSNIFDFSICALFIAI
jgi:hypothetical protein